MTDLFTWKVLDGERLVLRLDDPRLRAFEPLLELHRSGTSPTLSLGRVQKSRKSANTIAADFVANDKTRRDIEMSCVVATGDVLRIEIVRELSSFDDISLPFVHLTELSHHTVAEILSPDANADAIYTSFYRGLIDLGERRYSFECSGYGFPGYDLSVNFNPQLDSEVLDYAAPGLRDLADILGVTDDPHADLQWLPKELQSADLISLTEFRAQIEPRDPRKLTDVSVSLEFLSGKTWPIIPGCSWLEVGQLNATLEVEHPLDKDYRFPRLSIRGTVQLDKVSASDADAHIDLEVRWPDLAVQGELRPGTKIVVAKLLEHIGLSSADLPEGDKALSISELGFSAEPDLKKKRFFVHGTIENAWRIELPNGKELKVERVALALRYDEGASPTMYPTFDGVIALGDLQIYLSVHRESDGWDFSGSTRSGDNISVGQWISDLSAHFGDVAIPELVSRAVLQDVDVRFNSASKDFHFSIVAKLPMSELAADASGSTGGDLDIILAIDLLHHDDIFEKRFSGEIQFGSRAFDLRFSKSESVLAGGASVMVATYQSRDGDKVTLKDLLSAAGADASEVPDSLSVTLHSALFAFESTMTPGASNWKVFGVNIDGGLNLSNLPLLGKLLPANETMSLEFQALYSSTEIAVGDEGAKRVGNVNALLPPGATALSTVAQDDKLVAGGIGLATTLHLGTQVIHLNLPVVIDKANDGIVVAPSEGRDSARLSGPSDSAAKVVRGGSVTSPEALPEDGLKWFPLNRSFGPAHFERIGAGLADGEVRFVMDASLNIGGLSLSLDGLGVSTPLDKFDPSFKLRGIGIDYASGPVEIGGSFLRLGPDNFAGTALIRTEALTLSAIGAYGRVDGETSLFIYAVLDYPLGGPSFFFVTGMAAGFGYNRSLLMPPVAQIPRFPLVAEATAGAGLPKDVMSELKKLGEYLPPDAGQYFLAVGVKFNSFKLIDSFALLAVSFGKRFEIDVLGQSTLVVPTQIPGAAKIDPLARITVALLARFIPDEGSIGR